MTAVDVSSSQKVLSSSVSCVLLNLDLDLSLTKASLYTTERLCSRTLSQVLLGRSAASSSSHTMATGACSSKKAKALVSSADQGRLTGMSAGVVTGILGDGGEGSLLGPVREVAFAPRCVVRVVDVPVGGCASPC